MTKSTPKSSDHPGPASSEFEAEALSHLDAVFRFSIYLTGDQTDAEDLSQDAVVQALRKHHLFRPGTDLKAWLFRVTRNLHIDRIRRRKLAPQVVDLSEMAIESREPTGEPTWEGRAQPLGGLSTKEEDALYERLGDEVKQHLLELPQAFRMAIFLCDVEELAYEEIAQVLDCPVGTVRSRISRARQYLREKLHEYARELGFVQGKNE